MIIIYLSVCNVHVVERLSLKSVVLHRQSDDKSPSHSGTYQIDRPAHKVRQSMLNIKLLL